MLSPHNWCDPLHAEVIVHSSGSPTQRNRNLCTCAFALRTNVHVAALFDDKSGKEHMFINPLRMRSANGPLKYPNAAKEQEGTYKIRTNLVTVGHCDKFYCYNVVSAPHAYHCTQYTYARLTDTRLCRPTPIHSTPIREYFKHATQQHSSMKNQRMEPLSTVKPEHGSHRKE